MGPPIPYFDGWLQRLIQDEYEIHVTPSRFSDEQPQDLCWSRWDRAGVLLPVAMLAGRILGAAGGQLATRRQSLLDMMPAQRKDEVAKETVSRHPGYQSPSELLPMHEEPRSPFSLGFICAVPKGINETKPIG